MRLLVVMLATVLPAGTLFCATSALAQTPPDLPPPVVLPATPDSAVKGTLTEVTPRGATLQTTDGKTIQLALRPGYLLVNSSSHPLSTGQRVFAIGATNSDGSINVEQIDVLIPSSLMAL